MISCPTCSDFCTCNTIPLKSLSLSYSIQNSLVSLLTCQSFVNCGSSPLECHYKLPVLPESAITSLRIRLPDGSVLASSILEKQTAEEKYQDKIAEGHTVTIAKQKKNKDFFITIGNLLPKEGVFIEISLCFPMKSESGMWGFEMPMGFIPSRGRLVGIERLDEYYQQPNRIEYTYSLAINLDLKSDLEILSFSSNWPLKVQKNSHQIFAEIGNLEEIDLGENFRFSYSVNEISPFCVIQQHQDNFAAMVSFIPYCLPSFEISDLESTGEYLFVLDRSGSMSGSRIKLAVEAAKIF